jgi:hypothetical protein
MDDSCAEGKVSGDIDDLINKEQSISNASTMSTLLNG